MAERNLSFEFAGHLPWQVEERTITSTLSFVVENFISGQQKNLKLKPDCDHFAATAINYIHQSNLGECVGTQSLSDTSHLLNKATSGELHLTEMSKEERESVNTYQALCHVERLIEEMDRSGLLTVQLVCDIHAIVLQDLHPTAGRIRDSVVCTTLEDGGMHMYPPPLVLEDSFYCLIDRHNVHMAALDSYQNPRERVEYVFKCAAWLLFHLVSLHPFPDGNGRTCRLLASYILSSVITPFPVSLCHSDPQSSRRDYINAIVHCRENPEEGPAKLASLLLEGAYLGWNQFESTTMH